MAFAHACGRSMVHLGHPQKTLRVFGGADRRIQAAADYFHSLLTVHAVRKEPVTIPASAWEHVGVTTLIILILMLKHLIFVNGLRVLVLLLLFTETLSGFV